MPAPNADRDLMIALAQHGYPPREIALELGVDANAVSCLLTYERRKGTVIPRFPPGQKVGSRRFVIMDPPRGLRRDLRRYAEARGLSVSDLAGRLLRHAAQDDLVDAILDDCGGRDV